LIVDDSWPHLGHVLNKYRDDGIDIEKTRNALCGQINNVLCYFGHLGLSPVVKLKLIKTFCCSLYGSVLWELDHLRIDSVCCMWRKGLDVCGMFLTSVIVISFLFSVMSFLCTTKFVNVLPILLIRV